MRHQLVVLSLFVLLLMPASAQAVTRTWDGPATGSWNTAANWSGDTLPTINDDVVIGEATVNIDAGNAAARSITTAEQVTVQVGRTLQIGQIDDPGINLDVDITFTDIGAQLNVYGSLESVGVLLKLDSLDEYGFLGLLSTTPLAGTTLEQIQASDVIISQGNVTPTWPGSFEAISVSSSESDSGWVTNGGSVPSGITLTLSGANAKIESQAGGTTTFASTLSLQSGATLEARNGTFDVTGLFSIADDGRVEAISSGRARFTNIAPADFNVGTSTLLDGEWHVGQGSRIQFPVTSLAAIDGADVTLATADVALARASDANVSALASGSSLAVANGAFRYAGAGFAPTLTTEMNIGSGGTFEVTGTMSVWTSEDVNVDGGTLVISGGGSLRADLPDRVTIGATTTSDASVGAISTLNATVDVSHGTLIVGGTVEDQVNLLHDEASLIGTGTVGSIDATDGVVSPGQNYGLMNVLGAVRFRAASILQVRRDGTNFSRLAAQGALTIDAGATMDVEGGPPLPAIGDVRQAVSFVGRTGTFQHTESALFAPWEFDYTYDGASISTTFTEHVAPTAPSLTIGSHAGGTPSSDPTIDAAVSGGADADSGVAGYRVVFTQQATATTPLTGTTVAASATSATLPDGAWYAHATTIDNAGNQSSVVTRGPFTIDTIAPAAPTISGIPDVPTTERSVTATFTGEAGATFRCGVDGATRAACIATIQTDTLEPGAHTLAVTAVDAAGNESSVTIATWTIVAPTIEQPTPSNPLRAPSRAQVRFVGRLTFAAQARAQALVATFPLSPSGVRITAAVSVTARQARALGLAVPRRAATVTIATATVTTTREGTTRIRIAYTRAAKAALARAARPTATIRRAAGTLTLTFRRGGLTSRVTKPITFTR